MGYRDPLAAAKSRVDSLRAELTLRAERVTPALIQRLPDALQERLRALEGNALRDPSDLDGWRELEQTLDLYAEALDRVVELAPEIDVDFNRLPRAIPKHVEPRDYFYFDIYDKRLAATRKQLHRQAKELLADCKLHDARPRYFDQVEKPMLVDASGRLDGHPIRLQIGALPQQARNAVVTAWTLVFTMLTPVRLSAPELEMEASLLGSLLALARLKRDTQVGDRRIDRRLVIDALQPDAERVFSAPFRDHLLELLDRTRRLRLVVSDGLARLDWHEPQREQSCITAAASLLLCLRKLPPVAMLRKRRRSDGPSAGG